MPERRQFRPKTRRSGFRDAKLIIIAAEGTQTEKKYFTDLATDEKYRNPKVHVEVLDRPSTASSPIHIIEMLDSFRRKYNLQTGYDELWLVIDIDKWRPQMLTDIASQCLQKGYSLAVSNPAFEVWLLLHLRSLDDYNSDELAKLAENRRQDGRTRLERELMTLCENYNKSNLSTMDYIPTVQDAIKRAEEADTHPEHRWPNQLGTRVYRLARTIIEKSHRSTK